MRRTLLVLLVSLLAQQECAHAFSRYETQSQVNIQEVESLVKRENAVQKEVHLKPKRKIKKTYVFNGEMPFDKALRQISLLYGIKYEFVKDLGVASTGAIGGMAGMVIERPGRRGLPSGGSSFGSSFSLYPNVSLRITTNSLDDLVKKLCSSADYYCEKVNGIWKIKKYETFKFDLPVDFSYSLSVSGEDRAQFTSNGSILKQLTQLLTPEGKIVRSPSGFFYAIDRPSGIRRIKDFLLKEVESQRPIKVKITVIRFRANKNLSTGIDWSAIFSHNGHDFKVDFNSTSLLSGTAFSFAYKAKDITGLLKILSEYGNAKIEKSWEFITRSGKPVFTESVKEVPWATQQTVQNTATATTSLTVNFKRVGLKIKVVPFLEGEHLKGTIYTEVSDLLDMVDFGNGVKAPETFVSNAMIAFDVPVGESIIITGLDDIESKLKNTGLPVLKDVPILGRFFSYKERDDLKEKVIVVITPEVGKI